MEEGEGRDLEAEPIKRLGAGFAKREYLFQAPNDDGVSHFRSVSKQFPGLYFVLGIADPNADAFGSAYIRVGKASRYWIGDRRQRTTMTRALERNGLNRNSDDDALFWVEAEAFDDMIALAIRRWQRPLERRLRRRVRR